MQLSPGITKGWLLGCHSCLSGRCNITSTSHTIWLCLPRLGTPSVFLPYLSTWRLVSKWVSWLRMVQHRKLWTLQGKKKKHSLLSEILSYKAMFSGVDSWPICWHLLPKIDAEIKSYLCERDIWASRIQVVLLQPPRSPGLESTSLPSHPLFNKMIWIGLRPQALEESRGPIQRQQNFHSFETQNNATLVFKKVHCIVEQIFIFVVTRLTSIIIVTQNSIGILQATIRETKDTKSNGCVQEVSIEKENHKTKVFSLKCKSTRKLSSRKVESIRQGTSQLGMSKYIPWIIHCIRISSNKHCDLCYFCAGVCYTHNSSLKKLAW